VIRVGPTGGKNVTHHVCNCQEHEDEALQLAQEETLQVLEAVKEISEYMLGGFCSRPWGGSV